MLLAKMLREARLRAGVSQRRAAEHVGVPQSYISKIEMFDYKATMPVVFHLCKIYEVDFIEFVAHWVEAAPGFEPEEAVRVVRSDKGRRRR